MIPYQRAISDCCESTRRSITFCMLHKSASLILADPRTGRAPADAIRGFSQEAEIQSRSRHLCR